MQPTLEQVKTEWFDPNALRLPNYRVGRVNYGQGRSYIRINQDGTLEKPFRLYTSLTTAINTCAPMERPLLEWYCKHGIQEADRLSRMAANYGTLMHREFGKFLKTNTYDFQETEEQARAFLSEISYYQPETDKWGEELKWDMAAFIQFFNDYKVIPLGIEYVLLSDKKGYGTLIDLVCRMTIEETGFWGEKYVRGEKAGQPKETKREREVTAVINFKSGRHEFYRSHGIQAICEMQLWEENFPDVQVERAYNWSPKEWRTTPSYNLKDWTGEIDQQEIESVLMLADLRYGTKALNKKYVSIYGQYYSTRGLGECVNIKTAEEYCYNKYSELLKTLDNGNS